MAFTKQHIKTSVVACIVDAGDHGLLTRRCVEPFCGQWVMPGGKIDHGETLLAALHREVREEVGVEVHVEGLVDVYEHVGLGPRNDHYVILYYRARPVGRELQPNGVEVTEARWVPARDLARYDMTPGSRPVLARIFPGHKTGPGNRADFRERDLHLFKHAAPGQSIHKPPGAILAKLLDQGIRHAVQADDKNSLFICINKLFDEPT